MTEQEVALFGALVRDACGIDLDAGKGYLLESRLAPLRAHRSWMELYRAAASGDAALRTRLIDAISTNETSFFRDAKAFELIKFKLLPDLFGADPSRGLRIWSAASSTGQEAYSIAMLLDELLGGLSRCRVRISGSDISESVVNAANRGDFSPLELSRGLSDLQIRKYFVLRGDRHRIRDELRGLCQFKVENLLAPQRREPFDLVLCRNALIYFSPQDKARALDAIVAAMKPGAALLVGSMEQVAHPRLRRSDFRGVPYYQRD